jgi:large conductance mechanosensitive channel
MRKLLKEFKEFALKGSVIDLAVGVIIGAAFGKIVSSLVTDVITPFISMFLGGVDFKSWEIELPRFFGQVDPIIMKPGLFVNTVIEFVILAFVIFIFIKAINKARKKKEAAPVATPEPSKEELLLTEIRDILKDK